MNSIRDCYTYHLQLSVNLKSVNTRLEYLCFLPVNVEWWNWVISESKQEKRKIKFAMRNLILDTAFDRGSSLRWKHRTTSYILLCIHIRPPRLSIYRSAVQCARVRARVCVTIFNLATICKHDATRRSANNSQGEFTRRRNPRSTSLLVIAYDSHRALCSSTYVRFSLLSFPPSIVLSYAPFRSPSVFHQFTVLSIRVQYCSTMETSNIFPSLSPRSENNNSV